MMDNSNIHDINNLKVIRICFTFWVTLTLPEYFTFEYGSLGAKQRKFMKSRKVFILGGKHLGSQDDFYFNVRKHKGQNLSNSKK